MRLHLCLAPLLLALPGGGDVPEGCPPLGARVELRIERFVIEARVVDGGRTRNEVVGFAEWRRRDDDAGPQLECDVRFLRGHAADAVREVQSVLQVECLTERGPRCQWREVGGGFGRSLQAEWSSDGGALDIVEWSSAGKKRGTLVASGGVSMPLYLAELVRAGRITAGPVTRFDPLARTLEPLMVRTVWLEREEGDDQDLEGEPAQDDSEARGTAVQAGVASEGTEGVDVSRCEGGVDEGGGKVRAGVDGDASAGPRPSRDVRTVELLRPDGTLAARYRFAGLELVSFQWQEGRLTARAVDADRFERLRAQHMPRAPSTGGARAR